MAAPGSERADFRDPTPFRDPRHPNLGLLSLRAVFSVFETLATVNCQDLFYRVNPELVQAFTGGKLLLLKFTSDMRRVSLGENDLVLSLDSKALRLLSQIMPLELYGCVESSWSITLSAGRDEMNGRLELALVLFAPLWKSPVWVPRKARKQTSD